MNWISFDVLQRLLDKVSLKEARLGHVDPRFIWVTV